MPAVPNVNEYVLPTPVLIALLVKLVDPVDWTLCEAVPTQFHVTVPPTGTVSTAGCCVLLWSLRKKMSPTDTVGPEAGTVTVIAAEPL